MASFKTAKRWFWWHKWTRLSCRVFLLMICITGLPLIFHEEIMHGGADDQRAATDAMAAPLDDVVANGLQLYPDKVLRFVYWDDEEPGSVFLSLSDSLMAPPDNFKVLQMAAHTGQLAEDLALDEGFMYTMLRLHTDMFAGIPGK